MSRRNPSKFDSWKRPLRRSKPGSRGTDRRLLARLRGLDSHELKRVVIFARGLLIARGEQDPLGDRTAAVTYRLESVRCGKPGCRSCPHGPYWYAYFRDGGALRKRYIGRERPAD